MGRGRREREQKSNQEERLGRRRRKKKKKKQGWGREKNARACAQHPPSGLCAPMGVERWGNVGEGGGEDRGNRGKTNDQWRRSRERFFPPLSWSSLSTAARPKRKHSEMKRPHSTDLGRGREGALEV